MKLKDKVSYIISIFLSVIAVLGLSIQINIQEEICVYNNANTFMWVIIVIFYWILSKLAIEIKDKRLDIITIITSIIIATLYIIGYMAENYFVPDMEMNLSSAFFSFLFLRFFSCCYSIYLIMKIGLAKIRERQKKDKEKKEISFFTNNKKSFFIVTCIIIIAYIPYWLQYFPGIASSDPASQAMQVLGIWELKNHQPVFHSFFIFICLKISQLVTSSYSGAVEIYCIIQMLVMAMTFSFILYYMAKKKIHRSYRIICFLIFAFFPLFPLYAITLQKDIFFAISVTFLTICIIEMYYNTDGFFERKRNYLYLVGSILGTMFFRNNGIYVIILLFISLIIALRKYYKQILSTFLICIMFFYIVTTWGYSKMNIKQGSAKEMFSIPLQFFARLEQRENENLTEEENERIYKYLPVENLGQYYNPRFSDPVKAYFSDDAFRENKMNFIKLYVKLAFKFPREAIKSFICNSYGYYYPDTLGWGIITETFWGDYGIVKEMREVLDWKQEPIINSKLIQGIEDSINKKEIPIVSTLYSIGFMFWILLICMVYIIYKKEYKLLLMFIPVLGVWLTSLASPVFREMRYVFSMFTCLPIFFTFSTIKINIK